MRDELNYLSLFTLRIQVCPKEGITPTFLFVSDGIGALNPLLGKVLDPSGYRVGTGSYYTWVCIIHGPLKTNFSHWKIPHVSRGNTSSFMVDFPMQSCYWPN